MPSASNVEYPQICKPRNDFWWSDSWACQVHAFRNVPHIHLQAVVYVVWPPYSKKAAEDIFRMWTSQITEGRLNTICVTLFPPDEGLDIVDAIEELDGDAFSVAKQYGYLPASAEDVDDILPLYQTVLAYDWKKGADGHWQVELDGNTAKEWGRDYGSYSYRVAERLDGRVDWE